MSETNEEVVVTPEENEGEVETREESITLSKSEWEKHNQTLGSLKRQLKDAQKAKETQETSTTNQKPDEIALLREKLDKQSIRSAGITHPDDVELAKTLAKKWNVDVEDLVVDEDFLAKLGKQQTSRANVEATSGIKGGGGKGAGTKSSPEYWLAKGEAPTDSDLSANNISRKDAAKIMRAFMDKKGSTKVFYND